MIEKLVSFGLRFKAIIFSCTALLILGGIFAFHELDIEAYPNPCPPLVETIVQPSGWSAEEVERYVTIPMEVGFGGMKDLTAIRSMSVFGLSDIKCYFTWGSDYWADRQETINRMTSWINLPNGLQSQISPWNAIGEVFRYTVEGEGYTLADKKTAEDWILEHQWRMIDGVIDVCSYGGLTKECHVEVDPYRLRGHGVTLAQLNAAIANANTNVGGQRLFSGEQFFDVRGLGMLGNGEVNGTPLTDIGNIVITQNALSSGLNTGTPVRVQDVADVNIGFAPRLGQIALDNDNDVVQGVVLMRYGGQTDPTLKGIHKKVDFINQNHVLPPGMYIKPYYERGALVKVTTHTVTENVVLGMILVTLVLMLFLNSFKAALVAALNIPLGLIVSFIGLVATNTSANLISLGAVDFGIVVDSTIIMMENIFRHLGSHGKGPINERILAAAREVGTPMTFSTLIIAIAFLPLFTLTGVAGVIFAPMARTYAFAVTGGIILALTLTPALASKVFPPEVEERESALMRWLHKIYNPLFDAALRRPKQAVALRMIPIIACVLLFPLLGRDFMPKLEEGNLWIRGEMHPSANAEAAQKVANNVRRILRGCPKDESIECTDANRTRPYVKFATSQMGRPDDGTDVISFNTLEFYAPLKPFDEWPRGMTKDSLEAELKAELHSIYPGIDWNFSQYIVDNVEEAVTGVKGENAVKVFGPDLRADHEVAEKIVNVMKDIPGVTDLGFLPTLNEPQYKITPDRVQLARYGLNTGDIGNVITAAIGGTPVTQVYENEKFFNLTVRWKGQYRASLDAVREITVSTPSGQYIPLGQVAKVEYNDGNKLIFRDGMMRYAPVKFSIRGRDLRGAIGEAQDKISKTIKLDPMQHLVWAGYIDQMNEAEARLQVIIPVTLLLITFLVYICVGNWLDTVIILIDIPVACTGGVLALLITGTHFSVSAAMGFVSVFGIAVQDALLMVTYFQRLHFGQGMSVELAAREAAEKRFRPVLMTTLVATLGLLPAALSTGIGSQTQKPLAIVVIGGSLELAILTRLLQPPLRVLAYRWLEGRRGRKGGGTPPEGLPQPV